MPALPLRDSEIRLITSTATYNDKGDIVSFSEEPGKPYRCRVQSRTGGYVSGTWSNREDGANVTYVYKVFVDTMPEGLYDGCLVELTKKDGTKERLRVRGNKPAHLSNQILLSL